MDEIKKEMSSYIFMSAWVLLTSAPLNGCSFKQVSAEENVGF